MEEVIEILSQDLETTTALGYGAVTAGTGAYVAYRNDFGAARMTDRDIEMYLEETEETYNPVKRYKRRVLNQELDRRDSEAKM